MDIDDGLRITIKIESENDIVKISDWFNTGNRNSLNHRDMDKFVVFIRKVLIAADIPKEYTDKIIYATHENIAKLKLLE